MSQGIQHVKNYAFLVVLAGVASLVFAHVFLSKENVLYRFVSLAGASNFGDHKQHASACTLDTAAESDLHENTNKQLFISCSGFLE